MEVPASHIGRKSSKDSSKTRSTNALSRRLSTDIESPRSDRYEDIDLDDDYKKTQKVEQYRWGTQLLQNQIAAFHHLKNVYGWKLLFILVCIQHLCKGGVSHMIQTPTHYVFKEEYKVDAPQMQVYVAAQSFPWAMKPVFGMLSDTLPIFNYRRMGYMIIALLGGITAFFIVGLTNKDTLSETSFVGLGFVMHCFLSTTDLLSEAVYSEEIKARPETGPDILSFIWGGMNIGAIFGIICVPILMSHNLRYPFLFCVIPTLFTLWPTCCNYFGEKKLDKKSLSECRKQLLRDPEIFCAALFMGFGSLGLSIVGTIYKNVLFNAALNATFAACVFAMNFIVFPVTVAKVNNFYLLQNSLSVSIKMASFYFYTDDAKQFTAGPHFSMTFYSGVLGTVGCLASLIGITFYRVYMAKAHYHTIIIRINIIYSILCLLDVVFFKLWHRKLGIDDHYFVLGASASELMVVQLKWLPGMLMMSMLCTEGLEATMFSMLAACHNLGYNVSASLGGALLLLLGVSPSGKEGEDHQFDNLWIAALISTILPLLVCLLIPYMIPDCYQTESITMENEISPWKRWRGITPCQKGHGRYSHVVVQEDSGRPSFTRPTSAQPKITMEFEEIQNNQF